MTDGKLYEVLGLTDDAHKDDIKRAYFRKIRIHTNEKHPEQFQLLTKAYNTLYDDHERMEYDRYHQDGGRYAILKNNVLLKFENEEYSAAIYHLQEMVIDYPNESELQYMLGECYCELGLLPKAKSIIADLIFDNPSSVQYRILLLRIYIQSNDSHNIKVQLIKLIDIDPLKIEYYTILSDVYFKAEQYEDSIALLERGWAANPMSLDSYRLLFDMYFISYFAGDEGLRHSVSQRMEHLAIVTDKRQILIFLINDCKEVNINHGAFPDLIRIIKTINNNVYDDVSNWVLKREDVLFNRSTMEKPDSPDESYNIVGWVVSAFFVLLFFAKMLSG